MTLDPVKPYADMARTIALAVVALLLAGMLFMGGRAVGKGQAAGELARKTSALADAEAALRGAAAALRRVNAEAKAAMEEAERANDRAEDAGEIADAIAVDATKRQAKFERDLAQARKNAACDALMSMDIRKECGQ